MFQCLVIYIRRDKIYYVHARARYILLSLFSQPRYSGHVCGTEAGRTDSSSTFHKEYALLVDLRHATKEPSSFCCTQKCDRRSHIFSHASALEQSIRSPSDHFHLLLFCRYVTKLYNIFGERCLIRRAKCQ
jgi:hypothetical protein